MGGWWKFREETVETTVTRAEAHFQRGSTVVGALWGGGVVGRYGGTVDTVIRFCTIDTIR